MMFKYPDSVLERARSFVKTPIYKFSEFERMVLRRFVTNTDKRVFFIHSLPDSVTALLLAMYSRIKNKRGLRGMLVDSFIPQFLAHFLKETEENFKGDAELFIKANKIDSLRSFVTHSEEAQNVFEEFITSISLNPSYLSRLAGSPKTEKFFDKWVGVSGKFGHNSILRMASVKVCFENISLIAAKSIEWSRPASGYIELSTRYSDMSVKGVYPVANELESFGIDVANIENLMGKYFEYYCALRDGSLPRFLRERYGNIFSDNPQDLENGITGESYDVLGNILPACTLTSLGAVLSGEAFPEAIKHLFLDNAPETIALAELAIEESEKVGANQFLHHANLTPWKIDSWHYLSADYFKAKDWAVSPVEPLAVIPKNFAEELIFSGFKAQETFEGCKSFNDAIFRLNSIPRQRFDKLPNHFEGLSAVFRGVMSFRGWRDLHRQGFCTHYRTFLTPELGFYHYDKPAPQELHEIFEKILHMNRAIYRKMKERDVPAELCQYPLAIGNLIGFQIGANLLQWEFCTWQRRKFSVNHEVRRIFLAIENELRNAYPWWQLISRADLTPAYLFARTGAGIPLPGGSSR